MNLYEAIYARHSVRKFCMEPVEDKVIDGIFHFLQEAKPLFPEIRICCRVYPERGEKPRLSGFSNVSAPHYLALFSENKEKSELNAGYVMEQIVLYLTSRGLGSCYQGMAKKHVPELKQEGLSCVMVLAFGYPKNPGKGKRRDVFRWRSSAPSRISPKPTSGSFWRRPGWRLPASTVSPGGL